MTRKTAKSATAVAGIALIAGLGLTVQPGPSFGTFHLVVPSALAQDSGTHTDGDHTDGGQQKGKTGTGARTEPDRDRLPGTRDRGQDRDQRPETGTRTRTETRDQEQDRVLRKDKDQES